MTEANMKYPAELSAVGVYRHDGTDRPRRELLDKLLLSLNEDAPGQAETDKATPGFVKREIDSASVEVRVVTLDDIAFISMKAALDRFGTSAERALLNHVKDFVALQVTATEWTYVKEDK